VSQATVPDSTYIFNPKIPIWVNFGSLAMEDLFIDVYFTAKWYILWPFCGHLVYFSRFGML
jgi:hypothetical protein